MKITVEPGEQWELVDRPREDPAGTPVAKLGQPRRQFSRGVGCPPSDSARQPAFDRPRQDANDSLDSSHEIARQSHEYHTQKCCPPTRPTEV